MRGHVFKEMVRIISLLTLGLSSILLIGCLDILCRLPMSEHILDQKIQVHDYTNVTLKPCHLLMLEGTRGARLIAHSDFSLGKGGCEQYPFDDTWTPGQFTPRPEDHAEYFDRLYFQIWYPGFATFDLGGFYSCVYVALSQDHGPYPEEALEYRLWVSQNGVDFTMVSPDTPIILYRRGWSALGENPLTGQALPEAEPPGQSQGNGPWPDVLNDDFTALWCLSQPVRYVRITPLSSTAPYNEPEIDAVIGMRPAPISPAVLEWRWPVEYPMLSQPYGVPNPQANNYFHTGIDVRNRAITCLEGFDRIGKCSPVFAAADGVVEKIFRCKYDNCRYDGNPESDNHNMQNVIIVKHVFPDGRILYSLYAHLGQVEESLYEGLFVEVGTPIGTTGVYARTRTNTDWSWPGVWLSHCHFEIKDSPVLHNPRGEGKYWGYTPGNPKDYGYHDPEEFLPVLPATQQLAFGSNRDSKR